MNFKKGLVIGACAVFLSGCQAITTKPVQPVKLAGDDVRLLFENQTVESFNLITGTTSFSFYRPDGTVLQERYWEMRHGTWQVTQEGQICMAMEGKAERCRSVFMEQGKYYKYRDDEQGGLEKIIRYRQFIDGNKLDR
jgi:hypothetical protein